MDALVISRLISTKERRFLKNLRSEYPNIELKSPNEYGIVS